MQNCNNTFLKNQDICNKASKQGHLREFGKYMMMVFNFSLRYIRRAIQFNN